VTRQRDRDDLDRLRRDALDPQRDVAEGEAELALSIARSLLTKVAPSTT
jgi:hypothetical protein